LSVLQQKTRPSRRARVLIAGGGIGGLSAAIALAGRGIDSTLLERSDFAEESGAGIQLGPNATRALRALGVLEAIEALSFRPEELVLYDGLSGAKLASMPLGSAIGQRYGAPYLTLHRADLHAGLLACARELAAVELREGFDVIEVEALADGVVAKSADGTETDGSCLIGADGLWSVVRSLVAPQARLRFTGATAWRALLPRNGLSAPFDAPHVGLWLGPRAHLVHYPVRGGKELNVVAVVEGGEAKQGWNMQRDAAGLIPPFSFWSPRVRDLLASVESWRCWSLYQLPKLRSWTRSRMALLGDAAHPVLPYLAQGAALAIEDAVTLASCLEACPGDASLALSRYETLRRHRTGSVQAQASRFGHLYHLRGIMARARNVVLSKRSPDGLLAGFDWLYGREGTDS
jgi:salicylate hydroxylase